MDRVDICEAHAVLEWDYNLGGWLQERPSNQRRREATAVQLHRLKFRARPSLQGFSSLTEDGKQAYVANVLRWGLPLSAEQVQEWLTACGEELVRELWTQYALYEPRPGSYVWYDLYTAGAGEKHGMGLVKSVERDSMGGQVVRVQDTRNQPGAQVVVFPQAPSLSLGKLVGYSRVSRPV